ncbi:hypothetical protein C8J56DRAFT_810579 [Mycena floridula]|nr:hypothetical protein C8J56DRAFT_810579 [Mycena floridula]
MNSGINEVVTDRNGIIMMVAVCPPAGDTSWAPVCDQAHNAMSKVSVLNNQVKLVPDSKLSHRRGSFLAVNAGMSFGGGQKRPGNLVHPKKLHKVLDDLRKDEGIKRIAGLQASILQTYAPKIHRKMAETITALEEDNPNLQRNFPNSPFAAAAYNCGPKTSCVSHADYGNAAGFFCVITACGQFPAASGAHFVNHTLKRIYRFPAGCSMIVLSASCRHGNTPLPPGFNRTSFTQFFAGGLLRWVDFGCQSVKSLLATEGGKQKKKEIEGEAGERAGRMLGLISRFSEVKDDLEALYPTAGS